MADWLALHAVSGDEIMALLAQDCVQGHADDPPFSSAQLWPCVADALARALPAAASVLSVLIAAARVDLAPDITSFPRAFTRAGDGHAVPFISCPVTGKLSDQLRLAHETGHACQYIAAGRTDIPPILRETAACLAETLLCHPDATPDPDIRRTLCALLAQNRYQSHKRHAPALRRALTNPAAPYRYGWNYPVAMSLAERICHDQSLCWQVMTADLTLPALVKHTLRNA